MELCKDNADSNRPPSRISRFFTQKYEVLPLSAITETNPPLIFKLSICDTFPHRDTYDPPKVNDPILPTFTVPLKLTIDTQLSTDGGFEPIIYKDPDSVSDPIFIVPLPVRILLCPPLYPQLTCARSPTIFQVPVAPISNFHHQLAGTVSLVDVVNSSFKGVDGSAACNTADAKSNAAIAVISLKKKLIYTHNYTLKI